MPTSLLKVDINVGQSEQTSAAIWGAGQADHFFENLKQKQMQWSWWSFAEAKESMWTLCYRLKFRFAHKVINIK